jgi:hypothetical protein
MIQRAQQCFTDADQQLQVQLQELESVLVGSVRLEPALQLGPGEEPPKQEPVCWFLRRPRLNLKAPGTGADMWFGKVKRILQHVGPDGKEHVLVEAEWHMACVFSHAGLTCSDELFRCPVIHDRPTPMGGEGGALVLAEEIVPWLCFPVSHPYKPSHSLMLARHWHITQYFDRVEGFHDPL